MHGTLSVGTALASATKRLYRVKSDGSGTGALSEDEDARRVATERRGVLRDPAHRFALVLDAEVARRAVGRVCRDVGAAEEAKHAESIVKRDHYCDRRGRQRVAVVYGSGSADVAAWRRPAHKATTMRTKLAGVVLGRE